MSLLGGSQKSWLKIMGGLSICDGIRKEGSHFCDRVWHRGEGGSEIAQICVTSFMNGPLGYPTHWVKRLSHQNYVVCFCKLNNTRYSVSIFYLTSKQIGKLKCSQVLLRKRASQKLESNWMINSGPNLTERVMVRMNIQGRISWDF